MTLPTPTETLGHTLEQPHIEQTHKLSYINVLESLVEAEVKFQIKALPIEVRRFVRPIEVMTYALNRLQPLYACSQSGVKAQREKAMALYGQQIAQVVTWGIRAVQKDPLRRFHPIKNVPVPTPQELAALESIRALLQDPSITRETLGERLHSSMEAKKIYALNQKASSYPVEPDSVIAEPKPAESTAIQSVSWKEYKNRRSLSERKNLHLLRSTGGAAGRLRLIG
jgi:hypothetical protein